jgi:hypothetical protein
VIAKFQLKTPRPFIDLRAPATLTVLNRELCDVALELQIQEIDLSSLLESQHQLSREIARWAFENGYAGAVFPSRLGDLPSCWAIFEGRATVVALGNPDTIPDRGLLKEAADILAIALP